MIRVEQKQFGYGNGTCLASCIASIFEVPLTQCREVLPPNNDSQAMFRWTNTHYPGLRLIAKSHTTNYRIVEGEGTDNPRWEYDFPEDELLPHHNGYWIGVFESPRIIIPSGAYRGMKGLHAVVMYNREVVWDPHPQRDMGLGRFSDEYYWELHDPMML